VLKTKLEGWEWFKMSWNETRTWMGYLTALSVSRLWQQFSMQRVCKCAAGVWGKVEKKREKIEE
jgi:hypothetical protein